MLAQAIGGLFRVALFKGGNDRKVIIHHILQQAFGQAEPLLAYQANFDGIDLVDLLNDFVIKRINDRVMQ